MMGITINGSGTITSSTGSLGFDDENVTTTGTITGSGASITALNASNLGSGTVPTARLGSGTASSSTFLAGDQTYKTVSSGLALLQTVTASNDSAIILDATAGFDGTYDSLLITLHGLVIDSDGKNLYAQVSTASNDPETGSSYFWAVTGKNQSDITSTASSAQTQMILNGTDAQAQIGNASGENASFTIEFAQPNSTSIQKVFHWHGAWGRDDHTGDITHVIGGGGFLSTTAITKFRLFMSAGNISSGKARLYGRTNS